MQKNSNLAYDLARFEQSSKKPAATQKKADIKVVKTVRRASPVKVAAIIAVVLAITGMMIYSQVVLTELGAQTTELNAELEKLQSENVRKTTELEGKMSLKNIEEYAVDELGLIKQEQSQVEYVNLSGGNKVEIKQKQDDSLWGKIKQSIQNLLEYLK